MSKRLRELDETLKNLSGDLNELDRELARDRLDPANKKLMDLRAKLDALLAKGPAGSAEKNGALLDQIGVEVKRIISPEAQATPLGRVVLRLTAPDTRTNGYAFIASESVVKEAAELQSEISARKIKQLHEDYAHGRLKRDQINRKWKQDYGVDELRDRDENSFPIRVFVCQVKEVLKKVGCHCQVGNGESGQAVRDRVGR